MKADYFADLVPTVPTTPAPDWERSKPHRYAAVPTVPTVPTGNAEVLKNQETDMPLAAKLRAYGEPWPLTIDGEIKCWLVPDDAAAKECKRDEPTYTAAEVEYLATIPAPDVLNLHAAKATFGGTIKPVDSETEVSTNE